MNAGSLMVRITRDLNAEAVSKGDPGRIEEVLHKAVPDTS